MRVLISSTDSSYTVSSSWDIVRHGVPQGSILGPLFFYINDLPSIFNNSVKVVLFADDTSLVISSDNNMQYRNEVSTSFARLNDWFNSNLLTLYLNKTKLVQFMAKPSSNSITSVSCHNNAILCSTDVKFLGIRIESSCTWKAYITQLLPELSEACYVMRVIKPIMPIETVKIVYYVNVA
jgi:hypothetical protein